MTGETLPECEPKLNAHKTAPDLRLAWISLTVLILGLLFLAVYPLGAVQGGLGIRDFKDMQQHVLLLAAPLGLGLTVGFIMSVRMGPALRQRFLWSSLAFFLMQLIVLQHHEYFRPFFVIHGVPYPNPIAWGITLASAGVATLASLRMDAMLDDAASRRTLSRFVAGASAVILLGSSAILASIFFTEWRQAPVVLDDRYELAWELTIPAKRHTMDRGSGSRPVSSRHRGFILCSSPPNPRELPSPRKRCLPPTGGLDSYAFLTENLSGERSFPSEQLGTGPKR